MTDQPGSTSVSSDDKLWAALGYPIFPIAIVMLLMEDKKSRPFIKYHAVQALALNVVIFVIAFILGITVFLACLAWVPWIFSFWPAYKAYQGEYYKLPVITDFIKKQGWVQ